jgi:branched-chain amino acid aminotransferase
MSKNFDFSTEPPKHVWLNGRVIPWQEATVPINVMGASGYLAVFEGIKGYWNPEQENLYVFRLKAHMRRLYDSMKIVRMQPTIRQSQIEEAVLTLLRANDIREDTYIRPVAFYDGMKLPSWRNTVGEPPDLMIWTQAFKTHLLAQREKHCAVSSWTRIADNAQPPRVKCTSNYQNNRMAFMQAALDGYDEALMLDDQGHVTESTMSCFFMVRDGVVITPPVTSRILESITRATVIQLCREVLDLSVLEREVDRTELYLAEEAFLCGTGEEITAVTHVDRLSVGKGEPGPMFKSLEKLYHDVVRGIHDQYDDWCTPVYSVNRR